MLPGSFFCKHNGFAYRRCRNGSTIHGGNFLTTHGSVWKGSYRHVAFPTVNVDWQRIELVIMGVDLIAVCTAEHVPVVC